MITTQSTVRNLQEVDPWYTLPESTHRQWRQELHSYPVGTISMDFFYTR